MLLFVYIVEDDWWNVTMLPCEGLRQVFIFMHSPANWLSQVDIPVLGSLSCFLFFWIATKSVEKKKLLYT